MACAQELDEQNIPAEPHQAGATGSLSTLLEIITEPLLHIRDFLSQGDIKGIRKRNRLSVVDQMKVSDCIILISSSCAYTLSHREKKIRVSTYAYSNKQFAEKSNLHNFFSPATNVRRPSASFVLHWNYEVDGANMMEVYLAQDLFCKYIS